MKSICGPILICLVLLTTACKDNRDDNHDPKIRSRVSTEHGNQPSSLPGRDNPEKMKGLTDESTRQEMPAALQTAFARIRSGEDKITVYRETWDAEWRKSMCKNLGEIADLAVNGTCLSRFVTKPAECDGRLTVEILRTGGGIGDLDRTSVLVLSTILCGAALDKDIATQIPILLAQDADRLPPMVGDCLIYKLAGDLERLCDPTDNISQQTLQGWSDLAKARNPAYRMFALRVFGALCPDVTLEAEYFGLFCGESDPNIAMSLVEKVQAMPKAIRNPLLAKIADEQQLVGNSKVAAAARAIAAGK